MCGFVGICSVRKEINIKNFNTSLSLIKHRGPDASDVWSSTDKTILLGHNRLSIIDTSSLANQPFCSQDKQAIIVFNGEIYNYELLKRELSFNKFRTNSDTEVILEGYLQHGVDFFKKLRGIYSFAILDKRNGMKFILARDPGGIKPLYYHLSNDKLIFGSEIKALKPLMSSQLNVNNDSIKQFLNLGFVPEPYTVYQNIKALSPGFYLKWDNYSKPKSEPFFEYQYDALNNNTYNQNVNIVEKLLEKAVNRNLIADVDISLSLSGGIDSSLVYYYAQKEKPDILAQTIAFSNEPNYNESRISKVFSNHLSGNHIINEINETIDLDFIDKIFLHFDQPYADSSAIPVYFINKYASDNGKVIIGGDGGDELFNGYPSQNLLSYFLPLSKLKSFWKFLYKTKFLYPDNMARKIIRIYELIKNNNDHLEIMYHRNSWFPLSSSFDGAFAFSNQNDTRHIDTYKNIFFNEIPNYYKHKIIFEYFRKILLSDYLRKTDMMSMINGVEWRVPMLDEDLTSFALSIPFNQKSSFGKYKKPLRSIHSKKFPKYTSKKSKSGFQIPLDSYINENNKKAIASELLKKNNIISDYLNEDYLKKLISQFYNHNKLNTISRASTYQRILMLYVLQRWSDNN